MILFMPNKGLAIDLQPSERTQLEQWESAHGTPQQVALRCRIILGAVAGQQNVAIAEGLGVSRPTVQLWRKRGAREGHRGGLGDRSRSRTQSALYARAARPDHSSDLAKQAQGYDPLELPAHGRGARGQQEHGEPFMAAAQYQAASEPHF